MAISLKFVTDFSDALLLYRESLFLYPKHVGRLLLNRSRVQFGVVLLQRENEADDDFVYLKDQVVGKLNRDFNSLVLANQDFAEKVVSVLVNELDIYEIALDAPRSLEPEEILNVIGTRDVIESCIEQLNVNQKLPPVLQQRLLALDDKIKEYVVTGVIGSQKLHWKPSLLTPPSYWWWHMEDL